VTGGLLPNDVLRDAPVHTPSRRELADLELLLAGACAPLTGFLGRADLTSQARTGRLADGTAWPVPVTLEVPADLAGGLDPADSARRTLVLTDPGGAPVAMVEVTDVWPTREGWCGVGGPVRRLGDAGHGPFRRLRKTPEEVRGLLPPGRVLGVIADRPLHRPQLAQIAHAARTLAAHLLVLIPIAEPTPDGLPPEALVRCVLAARDRMPPATLVAVPLARRTDEIRDALLRSRVAAAYGVTHLLPLGQRYAGAGLRVLVPRELAYDGRDGQWRWREDIPPRNRRLPLSAEEIEELLDMGAPLPEWHTPPAVARELSRARPPRRQRGLVVFFTGLPGSGKSTIARGVADALLETGERTVTLLDGDVLRRELAVGPRAGDPDPGSGTRRIGWVAAEAARHGGLVLSCPVAPRVADREVARDLARQAGAGFVLVYISTPAEVCAQRDRERVYVRPGDRADVTGADDVYEPPSDPDLSIDTSQVPVRSAIEAVLGYLGAEGWIDPRHTG
jgi:sulfate adenylyltransferase